MKDEGCPVPIFHFAFCILPFPVGLTFPPFTFLYASRKREPGFLSRTPKMKEMSWRKVLADRSCGDPRAYRLIQARSDKTSLRSVDYVKSLCSTSEFGFIGSLGGLWLKTTNVSFLASSSNGLGSEGRMIMGEM